MVNTAEMRMGLGDVSPRHPGVAPTVLSMLQSARRGLAEAAASRRPAPGMSRRIWRPRAAAAVVAARGEPRSRRRKPHSVWELLPQVEPALTEWAASSRPGRASARPPKRGCPARRRRARPMTCCGTRRPSCHWRRLHSASRCSLRSRLGRQARGSEPFHRATRVGVKTPQLMSSSARSAGDLS